LASQTAAEKEKKSKGKPKVSKKAKAEKQRITSRALQSSPLQRLCVRLAQPVSLGEHMGDEPSTERQAELLKFGIDAKV
jgi:hypothetical protein